MAKQTYTTTMLVRHNGKDYPEGKPIALEDDEAAPLLDAGAIAAKKDEKPEKK